MRSTSLYRDLLGPAWYTVDHAVRTAHLAGQSLRGRGSFQVTNGKSPLARALIWLLRMPRATARERVELVVDRCADGELWTRCFGDRRLVTTQRAAGKARLAERVGCLEFQFRLDVVGGAIRYEQETVSLRLGSFGLRLPSGIAPRVTAVEAPARTGGGSKVSVSVTAPLAGPLLAYEGNLRAGG